MSVNDMLLNTERLKKIIDKGVKEPTKEVIDSSVKEDLSKLEEQEIQAPVEKEVENEIEKIEKVEEEKNPLTEEIKKDTKEEKKQPEIEIVKKELKKKKYGLGVDVGTGFLVSARYIDEEIINCISIRDAFYRIEKHLFNKQMFNKNKMKYIETNDEIYVVGDDALTFARIQNASASRPLSEGIINPKEKASAPILREMFRYIIQGHVAKTDEKLVFSIPGPQPSNPNFDTVYHSMSLESLLRQFDCDPVPQNEAFLVVVSELGVTDEITGLGFSFGAGLVNVCLAEDTKIPLLNGEVKTIKELVEDKEEEFWVYSCKEDGSIVPGKAFNPRKTGHREVIKIWLDNDEYFECTEDHLIMLRDGSYKEAGKLEESESLMPFYKEIIKNQHTATANNNHKVLKIERNGKYIDVYDLSVEKYHNFAIESEVFVHNCFSFKGVNLFEFSIDKSGDFIDQQAAKAVGESTAHISYIKENDLDLSKSEYDVIPEERALIFSHRFVLQHTLKEVKKAFVMSSNIKVIDDIPIVVSGGTSMPPGFLDLFKKELKSVKLPFKIGDIVHSSDPLKAVAKGACIYASSLE